MKLVHFSICSDIHPEKVQIQNAWVVEHLNLPKHEINPDHLRNKFSHLKDVDLHLSDADNVSILIGADIRELHICYNVRQGEKNQPIERALGILWNPETDTFLIKYTLKSVLTTKQGVVSLISSIFDLLGFITPALTEPKWIIQQLWKRKIDWDELLPSDLTKRWQKWLGNVPDIQNITLDRWYGSTNTDTELNVFADASKIAYGVACYIRFKVKNRPNAVLLCQNPNLRLSIRSQNRFHNLNYRLP